MEALYAPIWEEECASWAGKWMEVTEHPPERVKKRSLLVQEWQKRRRSRFLAVIASLSLPSLKSNIRVFIAKQSY